LVTLGQRRGLNIPGGLPGRRYVVAIDHEAATVTVGDASGLARDAMMVRGVVWSHEPIEGEVWVQCSAHGRPHQATITLGDGAGAGAGAAAGSGSSVSSDEDDTAATATVRVTWHEPQRAVSPGQSVVFYDATNTSVLGGGIAT
jgi:tRNA-specific 2-thiouridylase